MRNRKPFDELMKRLAAAFNRPLNPSAGDAYWTALSGITDDEFEAAVREALTRCDRWPVPKVLMALALEERARLRPKIMGDGPGGTTCPCCGAPPLWHPILTAKGEAIERRLIRHDQRAPCARYNAAHRFAAAKEEI